MEKVLDYLRLLDMLKEIDTEKNDAETIRETLDFIADELAKYVDLMKDGVKNDSKKDN